MVSQHKNSNKGLVIGNKGSMYYYEIPELIKPKLIRDYNSKFEACETWEQRKKEMLKFCEDNGIIFKEIKKEA